MQKEMDAKRSRAGEAARRDGEEGRRCSPRTPAREKQEQFERKRRDAARLADDFQKELEKKEPVLLQKVLQDVSGVIERVGKEKGYYLIVEKRGARRPVRLRRGRPHRGGHPRQYDRRGRREGRRSRSGDDQRPGSRSASSRKSLQAQPRWRSGPGCHRGGAAGERRARPDLLPDRSPATATPRGHVTRGRVPRAARRPGPARSDPALRMRRSRPSSSCSACSTRRCPTPAGVDRTAVVAPEARIDPQRLGGAAVRGGEPRGDRARRARLHALVLRRAPAWRSARTPSSTRT